MSDAEQENVNGAPQEPAARIDGARDEERPKAAQMSAEEAEGTTIEEAAEHVEAQVEWLPSGKAARAIGVSKTTLRRKAKAGDVATRKADDGATLYCVSAAAIRAMARVKRDDRRDLLAADIVRELSTGSGTPEAICRRLAAPPMAVKKAIAELDDMRRDFDLRQRARRIYEYEHGSPNHPTSWAWVATKSVGLTFAAARGVYDDWIAAGGDVAIVSPLVRAALSSEAAWDTSIACWKAEWAEEQARRKKAEVLSDLDLSLRRERAVRVKLDNAARAERNEAAASRRTQKRIDATAPAGGGASPLIPTEPISGS